ncbi:hypothetical protein KFK09_001454 [Dendrobium nobile]|uniref:Uncharacterized protein n=1 Tax=Dendrobium nobile TaxID=94219 RepID=A0A8T3C510_DENNO|nr:hypothetical protein KFK09_001454 [Dendrobium nobile]
MNMFTVTLERMFDDVTNPWLTQKRHPLQKSPGPHLIGPQLKDVTAREESSTGWEFPTVLVHQPS